MEKRNLNIKPEELTGVLPVSYAHTEQARTGQSVPPGTMDVTGSLRKIARELSELRYDSDHLERDLEAASWLITYIADCLDVEIKHAVERGRRMSAQMNGNVQPKVQYNTNTEGQRIYEIIQGEEI